MPLRWVAEGVLHSAVLPKRDFLESGDPTEGAWHGEVSCRSGQAAAICKVEELGAEVYMSAVRHPNLLPMAKSKLAKPGAVLVLIPAFPDCPSRGMTKAAISSQRSRAGSGTLPPAMRLGLPPAEEILPECLETSLATIVMGKPEPARYCRRSLRS